MVMRRARPCSRAQCCPMTRSASAWPEPGQGQGPDGILEAREGGLRGQGGPGERIAVEQELVQGIVGQPGGVVAVGIAAGQAEDPFCLTQAIGCT